MISYTQGRVWEWEWGGNSKISAKTTIFLVLRGKKNKFRNIQPPKKKLWNKSTSAPPGKNPSETHAHKHVKLHHFCEKNCCITPAGNTVQQQQCGKQAIAG